MTRPGWTHVTVRTETRDRLRKHQDYMRALHEGGIIQLPADQVDGVSVDYMVNHLINLVEAHRDRAQRQHRRAKHRRQMQRAEQYAQEQEKKVREAGGEGG